VLDRLTQIHFNANTISITHNYNSLIDILESFGIELPVGLLKRHFFYKSEAIPMAAL